MQLIIKKNWKYYAYFLVITLCIGACSYPDKIIDAYESGIFICNEGKFNEGTGTISHVDVTTNVITPDVFGLENSSRVLGNIVQSMFVFDGTAFIVVNNANKVEVVQASSFKSIGIIEGLALPRYFITDNNDVGYVSQWGADGVSGSVAVVNLKTLQVIKTIPTGVGAERLAIRGNRLYVCNGGAYNTDTFELVHDNSISVIDMVTNAKVNDIELLGQNPNSIVVQPNGDFWVLCGGINDFSNPAANVNSAIYQYSNDLQVSFVDLGTPGAKNVQFFNEKHYFLDGDGELSYIEGATSKKFINGYFYNFGINTLEGQFLLCDAKDFNSNGTVEIYNTDAQKVRSIEAGIIPSAIWVQP